jgi:altered-inheritance-of-mitochondria protein 5
MVLSSLIEETPQIPETSPRHVVDGGLFEMAKDRWNRELESAVRRAYETDWRKVREQAEDSVTKVVERIREGK